MDYPKPETLRAEAAALDASAPAAADASEYPRVAKFTIAGQSEALRDYAATIEAVGDVPDKRPGMTGEERRERRASILRLRAARLKVKSSQFLRASHDIGSRIPFGQPILVGHHSERGHRRAIERMHSATSKGYSLSNYADSLESRADHVERSNAISSTDSDALDQYRAKLEKLTAERDSMKAVNAAWRKFEKSKNPEALHKLGMTDEQIASLTEKIATAYSWEKAPYVGWSLTNLGATIRDTQKKIAMLERRAAEQPREVEAENGIRLEDSPEDNRVRLFFPGKPDAEVRTTLKRNGFRWAPSLGCWQAYRNWRAQQTAESFVTPAEKKVENTVCAEA